MLIDRLNKLLDSLRKAFSTIGKQIAGESWGYGHCTTENDSAILEYKSAIKQLRDQHLAGGICITDKELEIIESNIHRILGPECKNPERSFTKTDSPTAEQWILNNPGCQAYETWSEYLYAQCQKIGIDFKVFIKKCDSLDIDVKVANKTLCDIVDIALTVKEEICSVDVNVTVDEQKCGFEFQTVITPLGCDITFETYVHAIKCGLTVDLVADLLKCGATLKVTATDIEVCYPEVPAVPEIVTLDFSVTTADATICYYTDIVVELEDVTHPAATYVWDFGSGAVADGTTGLGPHTVQWTTAGTKTITVTGDDGSGEVIRTLEVVVSTCIGHIAGTLFTDLGAPMSGYNLALYQDFDEDGVAGTQVKSIFTNPSGGWVMVALPPGNYLLVANLPLYTLISATDTATGAGPSGDPVVDTLIILPDNNAVGREAFKIEVKPGLVQGTIELVATLT